MPHGYCNDCKARVTVRGSSCLLGHHVDLSTISDRPGRRATRHRKQQPVAVAAGSYVGVAPPTVIVPKEALPALDSRQITVDLVAATPRPSLLPPSGDLEPTRARVQELWVNTPDDDGYWEGELPSLDDPSSNHRIIGFVIAAVLLLGIGFAGFTMLWPHDGSAAALEMSRGELSMAVSALVPIIESAGSGRFGDPVEVIAGLAAVDEAATTLMSAAGAVPPSPTRTEAVAEASTALDLVERVRVVSSFESAARVVLVRPVLPTTGGIDQLGEATAQLADWTARLADTVDVLPDGADTKNARALLVALVSDLDELKTNYLNQVRDGGDPVGALETIDTRLEAIDEAVAAMVRATATSLIP